MTDQPSQPRRGIDLAAALRTQAGITGTRAWIVGGAIRDALMGRPTPDYDLAVQGNAKPLAQAFARAANGHVFRLSDAFGSWRVSARDGGWQVDLTPLQGATIESDLAVRDLTVNAIARDVATPGQLSESLIDRYNGAADIAHRRLRAVSDSSFTRDPLRVLRLGRFVADLGFSADRHTTQLAHDAAPGLAATAPERVLQELGRTLASANAVAAMRYLTEIGATAVVLPELDALQDLEQSEYHHLDVYGHTMLTLQTAIDIETDPAPYLPGCAAAVSAYLSRPLAGGLTRGDALRFAALLHDIAKSRTRAVTDEGRVTFYDHDVQGAALATEILRRLRASDKLVTYVAAMARHHLRLGFLVHKRPLDARAIYEYLNVTGPVCVDVTLLSLADRFATLGKNHARAGELHLELAQQLLAAALEYDANPPRPLMPGDELADALDIDRGPLLGELIAELTAATYARQVVDEAQTLEHAREWLDARAS